MPSAPFRIPALLALLLTATAAWSGDTALLQFAAAACVGTLLAASRPAWTAGVLLALAPADLWLTWDAGGFTFRVGHVLAVALWAAAAARVGVRRLLRWTLGLPGLAVWLALLGWQALRLGMGVPFAGKAAGYLAWGIFDVLVLAPAVAFHARRAPLRVMQAWWPLATAVAVFGLLQLVLAAVGTTPPMVQQWVGARPRINALSYEPSYFAFQAMVPLALVVGAWSRRIPVALRVPAAVGGLAWAVAVALSSSRSGWIGLLLLVAGATVVVLLRRARVELGGPVGRVLAAGLAAVVLGVTWMPPHVWAADRLMAQKGLDLQDPSSAQPRREGVMEALNLARLYPVAGVGVGQFGAALLAHPQVQVRVLKPEERDPHSLVTFNLYAELLCENGVTGLLLVALALLAQARAVWRTRLGPQWDGFRTGVLWASVLTFGVMFQFNQTLWRAEAWCLLGLAMALGTRGRA